jgi:hypothetical protein
MCYEPMTLFVLSVILNILLGFGYLSLLGKYNQASKFMDDVIRAAKKTGKVK